MERQHIAKNELVAWVGDNIQTVLLGLVGGLYPPPSPTTLSFRVPKFRVVGRNINLGGDWGTIDLLVLDQRNTSFVVQVCQDTVTAPDVLQGIRLSGLLRHFLTETLHSHLKQFQQNIPEEKTNLAQIIESFEEVMKDRWQATSVFPVLLGQKIDPEALTLVSSLNTFAVPHQSVAKTASLIFMATWAPSSLTAGGTTPEAEPLDLEISHPTDELASALKLPQIPASDSIRTYASATCGKLISDFIDYEQQKRAHKSGMFRTVKDK
ncbi:MAG: hypothetical protein K1Y36_08235 [Blastocatellia bacterium]|nr:hypothetical protein [Blastocatellia bacterium]